MKDEKEEKLKYLGLILDDCFKKEPYISEEKAGSLFDTWYDKSCSELKIYYQVYINPPVKMKK